MQKRDDYINKVKHLPPAPRILTQLLVALRDSEVNSDRIIDLISYDEALTVKTLRICNSAWGGFSSPASDIGEAVMRLGFERILELVAVAAG